MKPRSVVHGLCTFLPLLGTLLRARERYSTGGGTASARYCYTVWLRHLIHARNCGLKRHPETVAELGPGDSIGCGMAALLSGCSRYYALDAVKRVSVKENLRVFDELVELFRRREAVPDDREFPEVHPLLDTYEFPSSVLHDERLDEALEDGRIQRIRDALGQMEVTPPLHQMITYRAPWTDPTVIRRGSVDYIFSQATLEHVDALPDVYECMSHWLKPGGLCSHTIDFRSHGTSDSWNGHWACSDLLWRAVRGRRSQCINREPCSTHMELLGEHGFSVRRQIARSSVSAIHRSDLSKRFRGMSHGDLTTSGVFVVGIKCD